MSAIHRHTARALAVAIAVLGPTAAVAAPAMAADVSAAHLPAAPSRTPRTDPRRRPRDRGVESPLPAVVQDQLRAGELRLGTGLRSTGTSLRFADDRGTVDPRTGVLTESLPGKLVYQENEDGQKVEVSLEDLTIVAKGAEARVMTTAMENGAALERFTYATFVALHPGTHLRRRARGPINTRRALP